MSYFQMTDLVSIMEAVYGISRDKIARRDLRILTTEGLYDVLQYTPAHRVMYCYGLNEGMSAWEMMQSILYRDSDEKWIERLVKLKDISQYLDNTDRYGVSIPQYLML